MTDGFSGVESASKQLQSKAEYVRHSNIYQFSYSCATMRQWRRAKYPENSFDMGIKASKKHRSLFKNMDCIRVEVDPIHVTQSIAFVYVVLMLGVNTKVNFGIWRM